MAGNDFTGNEDAECAPSRDSITVTANSNVTHWGSIAFNFPERAAKILKERAKSAKKKYRFPNLNPGASLWKVAPRSDGLIVKPGRAVARSMC